MQYVQFSSTLRNKGLKLKRQLGKTLHAFGRKISTHINELVERLGLIPQPRQQPALVPVRVRGRNTQPAARRQTW